MKDKLSLSGFFLRFFVLGFFFSVFILYLFFISSSPMFP